MKAIRATEFGGPDVLRYVDVATPAPGPGEALVRVAAAGVNFMDIGQRTGRRPGTTPPFIPGGEASGTVEAVGEGVTNVKPGDRVMYAMAPATYAEYAVAPAWRLIAVPDDIDVVEAGAIALQALTAHYLLHEYAPVGPGTTVLVHAVAGGMGLLLAQWATHLGAHVIGTTSTEAKAAKARAAGARDVILYTETDFAAEVNRITDGRGVDLILDAVGKTTFPGDLEAARPRGHIVVYGAASGQADPISPNALSAKGLTLSGAGLAHFTRTSEEIALRVAAIFAGVREGWLTFAIDRRLPLAQAADAHRALEARETSGKLLLIPEQAPPA
jgi:NADPH2:quinone reductase